MKKIRQEPVFLLEMPHALRHMIMRRGLMLRSSRARTLSCLNKGGPKAWLEAKLIPSAGESAEENWDKAHELAGKFKRELHADVYVEPALMEGRFAKTVAGNQDPIAPPMPHHRIGVGGSNFGLKEPVLVMPGGPGFGMPPMKNGGAFNPLDVMPHIPDPMAQINAMLPSQRQTQERKASLKFSPLYNLPGWFVLPESQQQMFETEAAQLVENGLTLNAGLSSSGLSTLEVLTLQPGISTKLKSFLDIPLAKEASV